jgi:hypothetical protein
MTTESSLTRPRRRDPWNKGRLIGQKRPSKPKDVWTIRVRLPLEARKRDLAVFNLAIDSKLRGCDLAGLKIDDVSTPAEEFGIERRRSRRRPAGRFSSRSPSKPAALLETGCPALVQDGASTFSRAAGMTSRASRRGSTLGSSTAGSTVMPDSTARPKRRTRCAARSQLRFTIRQEISEPCSCCSGTRSWRGSLSRGEVDDALSISEQIEL